MKKHSISILFLFKAKSYKPKAISWGNGFTLIEIIVAIAILASLGGGAYLALNPGVQVNKARDAASQQGLAEIRNALDSYYSDINCYPRAESVFVTALNTGGAWQNEVTGTVYIAKAPLDGYGQPYIYITDPGVECPQWYSLFTRLGASPDSDACPLDEQSACIPVGFDDRWACVTGGITNCALLSGSSVAGTVINYPTSTPGPSGAPTPTPSVGSQTFSIAMPSTLRPQFFTGEISNINPEVGAEVTLSISTDGFNNPYPVTSLIANVRSNNVTIPREMYLSGGTAQNGSWTTTWTVSDPVSHTFIITLNAQDSAGNQSSVDIVIR